ncbi:MAG: MipA/OmpV family protein [Nitrospirota bacterium]
MKSNRTRHTDRLLLGLIASLFFVSVSAASDLPVWEAGLGVSGLSMPDYRGSNQQRFYVLPIPYLIYRGEIFRVDKGGVYGLLFRSNRARLSMSADGGVPVKSDNNTARRGMPDLNPTMQLGPSLDVCLVTDCNADTTFRFRLPIRGIFAIATDLSSIKGIGVTINPQLNVHFKNILPGTGWNLGFIIGPVFATQEFHEYYYGVAPAYALPGIRPAYRASGGYSGTQVLMSVSKRFEHIWFGGFASYDELSGAAFDTSPLMRTKQSAMAGFGIAWIFAESKKRVPAAHQ